MKAEITDKDFSFAEGVMKLAKERGIEHFSLCFNRVEAWWDEPLHSFDDDQLHLKTEANETRRFAPNVWCDFPGT